jgi:ubiquinone/menaquinone biosynthesis C-methylase UbiE
MFLMTFDSKLVLCPIGEQLNRVLDVGTGTGIWAIDFGETFVVCI